MSCDALAVAGFMAFGPDATWPLAGYPNVDKYGAEADEKAAAMQKQLDAGKITEDFVAAAEFLLKHPQSTGKRSSAPSDSASAALR